MTRYNMIDRGLQRFFSLCPVRHSWLIALLVLGTVLPIAQAQTDSTAYLVAEYQIETLRQEADILFEQGDYLDALDVYRRILERQEAMVEPVPERLAVSLNDVARTCLALGRYADAEANYRRALNLEEQLRGPMHAKVASRLNNLAETYRQQGRYAEAEPLYRRVLLMYQSLHGTGYEERAISLNNLAELLRATGRDQEAEPLYVEAARLFGLGGDQAAVRLAYTLNNIGLLQKQLARFSEAEQNFRRALSILESRYGEAHPHVAILLNNLTFLLSTLGRHDEAELYIRRALGITKATVGERHPSVALNLKNLGQVLASTHRLVEAEKVFGEAWKIAVGGGNPEVAWKVQAQLMVFYRDSEPARNRLAIYFGKQAINTLQGLRSNVSALGKDTLRKYDASIGETYRQLSKLLIAEGRLVEAERVQGLLKEEEMFQFLRGNIAAATFQGRLPMTRPEAEQDQALAAAGEPLARIQAEMERLEGIPGRNRQEENQLSHLRQAYVTAGVAFQSVFDRVLLALGAARQDKAEELKDGQGIQDTLRELGERDGSRIVALYTIVEPESYSLILTSPEYRRAYTIPVRADALNEKILAWRESLRNPRLDPIPQARQLLDILLPVAAREELRQAGADTLIWHLDGSLRLLPLAALHDGDGYLVERYRLATFTGASTGNLKDAPKRRWNVLGLGVSESRTVNDKFFTPLPAVVQELAAIVREAGENGRLPGVSYINERFSWTTMQDALRRKGRYPLVHIASHFNLEPGNDTTSFLLPGAGEPITLAQLVRQNNLFGGVDLLTLSACETAVGGGRNVDGREVDGLAFIAQRQGAKAVLATLWPVSDQSTAQLMEMFYTLREHETLSKAEALRRAQLAMLSGRRPVEGKEGLSRGRRREMATDTPTSRSGGTHAHPFYWAPFVLMGNWL